MMTPSHEQDPQHDTPAQAGVTPSGDFVVQLTSHQRMLHAYIVTILGRPEGAEDVLQSVNLKVWEKASQFEPGTNFGAWVRRVAYLTVQEHWRKQRSDRSLEARMRLAERVSEHYDQNEAVLEDRQTALEYCMGLLPDHHRRWIDRRYRDGRSVTAIASERNCSTASVAQALYRIRQALKLCIERRLALAEKGGRRDG